MGGDIMEGKGFPVLAGGKEGGTVVLAREGRRGIMYGEQVVSMFKSVFILL